jgi:hypothetical protein
MSEQLNFTMPYEAEGGNPPGTVNVTMTVEGNEIVSIAGSLGPQSYQGSMHFTDPEAETCIVCGPPPMECRPVIPCPDGGGA